MGSTMNGLGAYIGKLGEKVKGKGGSAGQDYNLPAPTMLDAPQMSQQALPDTLAAQPMTAMAQGGVAPAGQPVVVGDAPKSMYDQAKDEALHAYGVGKAYLGSLANQNKAWVAPKDSEVSALKEKNQNINAAFAPATPAPAPAPAVSASVDAVHQAPAKGEQRIDTSHMTEPLGAAPKIDGHRAEGGPVAKGQPVVVGDAPEVIGGSNLGVVPAREEGGPAPADEPVEVGEARPETLLTESGKKQVVGQAGPEVITPKENAVVIPNAATAGPEKGPEMASATPIEKPSAMGAPLQAPPQAAPPTHGMASTGMAGNPKTAMAPGIPAPVTSGATDHPSGPTTAMATPPVDPLAKERALIEKDKSDAMVKGDMVGLGKALIHEKVLHASEANKAVMESAVRGSVGTGESNKPIMEAAAGAGAESTPTLGAQPPTALSMSPTGTALPAAATSPETTPVPKSAFKAREAQYDTAAQAGRDLATPEGDVQAAEQEKAKAGYEKLHPYGSALNHPGIGGKILHGLAKAGNIAGDIVAPSTMALIPGTALNKQQQLGQENREVAAGRQQEAEAAKATAESKGPAYNPVQELAKANTALHKAQASNDPAAVKAAQEQVDSISNAMAKNQPPKDVDLNQQLLDSKNKEAQLRASGDEAGANAEKENGQRIQESMNAKDKSSEDDKAKYMDQYFKDHPEIKRTAESEKTPLKDFATANQGPPQMLMLSPDAAGNLTGQRVAPGTSVTPGTITPAEASKDTSKWYTYADKDGVHYAQGKDVPAGVDKTEQEPKTFMREAETANNIQKSLNDISRDVTEHPEIWDNAEARSILATTLEQMDRQTAGFLVAGTGGSVPIPSGFGDILNTAMQNNLMDKKTQQAVKDYVSDYKSMKDQVIVMQMEMQNGKIGRGSQQAFKAIADQIPNGATPDSREAGRQMGLLQRKQAGIVSKYPDKYGNYTKEKPWEAQAAAAGTSAAPGGATAPHAGGFAAWKKTQ